MATRLYWHNTFNSTTGLPTTEQSSISVTGGASQSVNKNMTSTIGTSQASIGFTQNYGTYNYVCRWISDIISQSSIAANTWTITFGYADAAIANTVFRINLYVWRPSTTTKIGTIFDGDITLTTASGTTEFGKLGTFSGAAIASGIQSSDVLCLEFMFTSASPVSSTTYFDGTTVITTNNVAATSAASYIETPETISMGVTLRNLAKTIADVLAISGTHDRKRLLNQAVAPALTISDSESRFRGKPKTVSDSVTITSAILMFRGFIQTMIAQSISLTDTRSRLKGSIRTITEALTLTALIPRIKSLLRTDPTEALTLTDIISRLRGRIGVNPTQTLSISAVNSRIKNAIKTTSNPLSLSAINTRLRSIFRGPATQNITFTDIVARGGFFFRTVLETLSLVDSPYNYSKQPEKTISDSITIANPTTSRLRGKVRIFGEVFGENISLTSTLVKATTRLRTISQALNMLDILVVLRLKNKTITEPLTFTDLENISKLKIKTVSDSITVTDTSYTRLRSRLAVISSSSSNIISFGQSINKATTRLRTTLTEFFGLAHLTQKLKNGGTLTPTRLYFHNTLTTQTGLLPSTNQSVMGVDYNVDPLTTNRSMSTALGTGGQVSISKSITSTFGQMGNYYLTRFISPPLGQNSIAANTWKYSISAINTGFPNVDKAPTRTNTNPGPININLYVWRPSTGAKVGTIKDGDTSNVVQYSASSGQFAANATFTGASVANMLQTDVLVVECWMHINNASAGNTIPTFYYDGGVVTLTDGAVVTNHASFIETPESFSFNILRNLAKTLSTQTIAFLATSPIRIRGFIQTIVHVYNLIDTQTRKTTRVRSITPILTLIDSITRRKPTVLKSISQSLSLVDTPVKFATKLRAISNSLLFIGTFFKGKTGEHNRVIDHLLRLSDTTTKTANTFKAFYIRLLRLRGNK